MKSSQHSKRCFLVSIICTLVMAIVPTFPCVTVPTALASSSQEESLADSTPSLIVYPSPLNEQNCQTSNNKTWSCVVTLEGKNLAGILVVWNVYTPNSSISISPNKGNLVELVPAMRVTISNIPCMNTFFLFSGQVYGGGGVIPATVTWSCTPKPTPTPIHQPTPIPTRQSPPVSTPQPSPTTKITVPTSTPVATGIPRPTSTLTSAPTSIISSGSQSDPPVKGNDNTSGNIFLVSASIFLVVESVVALVLIAMLIRRKISKM